MASDLVPGVVCRPVRRNEMASTLGRMASQIQMVTRDKRSDSQELVL
jgi:hypothetical protein